MWLGRLAFFLVELDARLGWALGRRARFDPADPGGPYTSLMAYLPNELARELAGIARSLPGSDGHYLYPPGQLHVTVRSFGAATGLPPLEPAVAGLPPIALTGAGLGLTRDTVQLRLLPDNSTLGELRRRLARTHGVPARQPRQRLLAPVAFANVLRLNGPVAPRLRSEVAGLRRLLAGERIVLQELALVRTDKVATPARTELLARYTLES
jgi:hypothetical protein